MRTDRVSRVMPVCWPTQAQPMLDWQLRLGEGSGAALVGRCCVHHAQRNGQL
jgi:hypothetical protein